MRGQTGKGCPRWKGARELGMRGQTAEEWGKYINGLRNLGLIQSEKGDHIIWGPLKNEQVITGEGNIQGDSPKFQGSSTGMLVFDDVEVESVG